MAVDFAKQIFERFDDKQILVIGAGEMGSETLRYLQGDGARRVTVVNRNLERAEALAAEWKGRASRWENLDEHYWARKRLVIGGILLVNLILLLFQIGRALPAWNDAWFFIYQLTYFVPFTALMFSRSRRGDLTILVYLIVMFIVTATDLLPNSEWGNAVDLNPPSTLAPPDIRKL